MRLVIQRVSEARVEVEGRATGAIGVGLLALLGVAKSDTEADADYLVEKLLGLRVFNDEAGKMNRSVMETGGGVLVVSNFTVYGDCSKGRRPGFDVAAGPETLVRIVRVAPRRSTLRRTADDSDPIERIVVANADQMVVVCAVTEPDPQPRLIDRCLVAAEDAGVHPILCLTKVDLQPPTDLLAIYDYYAGRKAPSKEQLLKRLDDAVGRPKIG